MISLRRRIFLGSVLWTIGMIAISGTLFSLLIDVSSGARHVMLHARLQSPWWTVFALGAMTIGIVLVRRGLRRIDTLQSRLAGVSAGNARRLEGDYPSEIQPLVDDLNKLLESRDRAIERAGAKAGDMAHGLKTPLAILAQDVDRARAAGQHDLASSISQQVTRMRRQVDYHLSQARVTASGGGNTARASVAESADGLRRAMQRLFVEEGIAVDVEVSPEMSVRVQREDLDEMLGNLVENACKWTRSRVRIAAVADTGSVVITVDDDGQGIAPELRAAVLQRGVRADQAAPGSGLGLAIVRDLAALYAGSIALDQSPLGGLRASLRLPA